MPVYDEIWDGPGRNVKRVNGQPQATAKWYVTIHNTSNDATAAQEADYAKVRTDGVGAHYFIDNRQVLQSTNTDYCVGHVGSEQGNSRGISYEITGVNAWTRQQWLTNVAWDQLAAVIARDCAHFGIPVRLLTIDQMRAYNSSTKGFITHNMARLAWGGTTHTDPGPNFPMDHLLALVGGDEMFEQTDRNTATADTWRLLTVLENRPAAEYHLAGEPAPRSEPNQLKAQLDRIEAKGGVTLTPADLAAIVAGVAEALSPVIVAQTAAIDANTTDAVADLGEGGAAKVRND